MLTDALEETTELVSGICDIDTKLDSEERERLWTHRRYQHLVFRHVTLLRGDPEKKQMKTELSLAWQLQEMEVVLRDVEPC